MNTGDKVVYVDDNWFGKYLTEFSSLPIKDRIYTVRGLDPTADGIYLVGITATHDSTWGEWSFYTPRFRRIWTQEVSTSIEVTNTVEISK